MACMKPDVIVVGAGIIGASVARELAQENTNVWLFDRQMPAAEATWAAGGMLAPAAEAAHSPAMVPLSRASLDLYPAFVEEIEAETGLRTGFQRNGTLLAFFGPNGSRQKTEFGTLLRRFGFSCEPLTGEEARQREPQLNPEATAGLWLGDEASVDNRALGRAVVVAAQRRGVTLRSGVEVSGLLIEGNRCAGVMAAGEKIAAAHVVIAAGCYSAGIETASRYVPVRPIRGQMVSVDAGAARPAVVMRSMKGYMVPREDGRVVAGSTLEVAGFDKSFTPEGVGKILGAVMELVPSLSGAPILETWSGLRPDTPDHLPILGPTDIDGLSIATGHYRDGILLAPITARLTRQWLLGQKTDLPVDPFSPLRFAASSAKGQTAR